MNIPWLTLFLIGVVGWLAHSRGYWKARCNALEDHLEERSNRP